MQRGLQFMQAAAAVRGSTAAVSSNNEETHTGRGFSCSQSAVCKQSGKHTGRQKTSKSQEKTQNVDHETQNAQQAKNTCAETGVVLFLTITFVFSRSEIKYKLKTYFSIECLRVMFSF